MRDENKNIRARRNIAANKNVYGAKYNANHLIQHNRWVPLDTIFFIYAAEYHRIVHHNFGRLVGLIVFSARAFCLIWGCYK